MSKPQILLFPDANDRGGSSDASQPVVEPQEKLQAGELGRLQETAPEQDENAGKSLAEVIGETLSKSNANDEPKSKETLPKDSSSEEEPEELCSESEQNKEGPEGQKTKEQEDDDSAKDEGEVKGVEEADKPSEEKLLESENPIPVERFKEVITQRNEERRRLDSVKPIVENYNNITNFCRENSITPEQFKQNLEIQALLNTNPIAALEKLVPIVDALKGLTGDKLPQDLQEAVDAGEVSVKYAKEVAQSRAQTQIGKSRIEMDRHRIEQERQSMVVQRLTESVSAWEVSKRKNDPDYKPKASESEPDGKWEMCRDKFLAMMSATEANGKYINPVTTDKEMIELLEKSYSAVDNSFKRFRAKPVMKKPLRSDGSSNGSGGRVAKTIEEANTLQEAVKIGLRSFGHRL